jgi:predicted O-methyltransferase YrrM
MKNLPGFDTTIPCFFDSQWRNPNVGTFGPDPIIAHHLLKGGTYNGNTELPVSMVLYSLALANDARTIVETGVNHAAGATLWLVMAALANHGTYFGVDIRDECCKEAAELIREIFPDAPILLECGDALTMVPKHFLPGTIDFLFVDDNHHHDHVAREIETFLPLVRPGGLLCFHDILGVHNHDIWDVIQPYGAIRLVDTLHRPDHPFGGLGIIKKP